METKTILAIAIIAAAAMVMVPVSLASVSAAQPTCDGPQFPGCQGKGHQEETCTTVFAGKSDHVKFTDCPT